jgi:hypothetical protein
MPLPLTSNTVAEFVAVTLYTSPPDGEILVKSIKALMVVSPPVSAEAPDKVVASFFFKPTKSRVKLVPEVCIAFNELEVIPELPELFP